MKLLSLAFEDGKMIPKKYTCQGGGDCPAFEIVDPPADTASFAIIMHDPDAPGKGFTHWVIWNINHSIRRIEENTAPIGSVEGINGIDEQGWVSPCPPTGIHRYEFNLYALNSVLDIPMTAGKNELEKEMKGKILEEAMLLGLYKKE